MHGFLNLAQWGVEWGRGEAALPLFGVGGITSSPQIASSSVAAHIELSHLIYVANLKSRLSKGQFILEVECIA